MMNARWTRSVVVGVISLLLSTRRSYVYAFSVPASVSMHKTTFLDALDVLDSLNESSAERSRLLQELCAMNPTPQPAAEETLSRLAEGCWTVVYAPHMSFMGKLFRSEFAPVQYRMEANKRITSHARVTLPLTPPIWLSASGQYGPTDDDCVCRVDFNEVWLSITKEPIDSLHAVPQSWSKIVVNQIGRLFFIESVAIFPVSYLDDELVVFDFELLGTRICAKRQ